MGETITISVKLRAFVRKETKTRWSASCPSLGVFSQGSSQDDAKRCIDEAVRSWFESCIERGVLDRALQESNFRPLSGDPFDTVDDMELVHVARAAEEEDVRGDAFNIQVAIPAYQAASLSAVP